MNTNILDIQSKKEIYEWFLFLSKDLITNNASFFHYSEEVLQKYLKHPDIDITERFNQFYVYWNNFNNQKRLLQHFLSSNDVPEYPLLFQKQSRHIIHKFSIDFNYLLTEINTLKLNNKTIPYAYTILIQKLVKIILNEQVFPNNRIGFCNIDVLKNTIEIDVKIENETKQYQYKLTKFLQKWQNKFPQLYKTCNAFLIVSNNYNDMLLQSTFKQWTSCLNLINIYVESKVKYTCVNNIKNGNLVAYCILDLNDGKSIDEIMNDLSYHGLCYNRCFWRSSIKRLTNVNDKNDYIFVPECTSYGTIMQNAITYKENLFYYLNNFTNELNKSIEKPFKENEYFKIYKIMYSMFSDMFTYLNKNNQYKLYRFNENIEITSNKIKEKIIKNARYNISILTNDIIALLNVFKYFSENKILINYEEFIQKYYFKESSYLLNNSFNLLKKLNTTFK